MINIIKHGDKIFATDCSNCGCEFTYELVDVIGNTVYCPECGAIVIHSAHYNKIKKEETDNSVLTDDFIINNYEDLKRKWI